MAVNSSPNQRATRVLLVYLFIGSALIAQTMSSTRRRLDGTSDAIGVGSATTITFDIPGAIQILLGASTPMGPSPDFTAMTSEVSRFCAGCVAAK